MRKFGLVEPVRTAMHAKLVCMVHRKWQVTMGLCDLCLYLVSLAHAAHGTAACAGETSWVIICTGADLRR